MVAGPDNILLRLVTVPITPKVKSKLRTLDGSGTAFILLVEIPQTSSCPHR